jgi:hypothetical protein
MSSMGRSIKDRIAHKVGKRRFEDEKSAVRRDVELDKGNLVKCVCSSRHTVGWMGDVQG